MYIVISIPITKTLEHKKYKFEKNQSKLEYNAKKVKQTPV